MLHVLYYAKNYASIIRQGLIFGNTHVSKLTFHPPLGRSIAVACTVDFVPSREASSIFPRDMYVRMREEHMSSSGRKTRLRSDGELIFLYLPS